MTRFDFASISILALGVAAAGIATSACSAEEDSPPGSNKPSGGNAAVGGSPSTTGGSGLLPGGGTSPATTGGVATTGGTSSTAGAGGGTGGAGGGAKLPLCTNKTVVQSASIADFETYDGVVAAKDYRWIFGGPTAGTLGVHVGSYSFGDGSVEPTLALLAGHGGNFGLSVSVTNATMWGEGWGMYFMEDVTYNPACIDASKYKGVTMWVRGMVPTSTFSFGVTMAQGVTVADGGSCTGTKDTCKSPTANDLPVTTTWTQVSVLWADMLGGATSDAAPLAATGDNITGFSFGANLTFMPESEGSEVYVAVPGDISVAIDDLSFIE